MKMTNADLKAIWRSYGGSTQCVFSHRAIHHRQVDELHRDLQAATAHTLSIEVPTTPAQPDGALFAGLDVGEGLFSGLDLVCRVLMLLYHTNTTTGGCTSS